MSVSGQYSNLHGQEYKGGLSLRERAKITLEINTNIARCICKGTGNHTVQGHHCVLKL